jgi:RNA recognition motif-containing protein
LKLHFADEIVVPVRSRVRLVNLPKKRKIDRDLKSAFQGIPGITNIVPAVIGNKKTRDPVCKGFAFVDFKHEDDAVRCVLTSIL